VFVSGVSPHLTRWFYRVMLGLTTISKMVSESFQDPLGHLLSGFRYQTIHHLCPRTKPNSVGRGGGGLLKSLTSDKIWSEHVFISGDNPHVTTRFCEVVLDPTTISKTLSLVCHGCLPKIDFQLLDI